MIMLLWVRDHHGVGEIGGVVVFFLLNNTWEICEAWVVMVPLPWCLCFFHL